MAERRAMALDRGVCRPVRRRFLLVGPLPPPAHGNSMQFELLGRELRRRGHDCRTVDLSRRAESPYSRFTAARARDLLGAFARFALGLAGGYRRVYLVVAQSRQGFLRDAPMIWSAWASGARIAAHMLGGNADGYYRTRSPLWRFLVRATLRRVRRIVVESESRRGAYALDAVIGSRIAVVPNSPTVALEGRPRTLGRDRPVRILFLSNMIQSKGYADVLEAVEILHRTTSIPLEAVFAGRFEASVDDRTPMSPETAEARFRDRIAAAGLGGVVRYAGPVAGRDKWRLFETSDFFVLPTRYINESLPLSIIEAMAHGCVAIATDFRAIPDLVADGVTGALVEYGRPDRIADAIRRLSADPERYAAMSRAAVARYEANFTLRRYLDSLIPLLEEP